MLLGRLRERKSSVSHRHPPKRHTGVNQMHSCLVATSASDPSMHNLHAEAVESVELFLKLADDVVKLIVYALDPHDGADGVECLRWSAEAAVEVLAFGLVHGPDRLHKQEAGAELVGPALHLRHQGEDALPTRTFGRRKGGVVLRTARRGVLGRRLLSLLGWLRRIAHDPGK